MNTEALSAAGKRRKHGAGAVTALVLLLAAAGAAPARAQSPEPSPEDDAPAAALAARQTPATTQAPRIGGVKFSGSVRARMESWSWFEAPPAESDYTFGALNVRLALEQKKERIEWRIEGLFPVLFALPANSIAPGPQGQLGLGATYFAANGRQDASAVFRQGYVRFKHRRGQAAYGFRLGRFEFSDGAEVAPADATLAALKRDRIAQRLIGSFGFSHVGRGFDGVEFVRNTPQWNLTLLAARPTEGVFQVRSLHQLDVDLHYAALTRQLAGASSRSEWRAFVLHYHDGRRSVKTDNRALAARTADTRNIRLTTFGGHWLGVFGTGGGKTDLLFWGAAQAGRWGALDHRAFAIAAEAGRQFDAPWRPWLRGGYFYSTGDGDPNDDEHTTFFQVLPTPRIYARFPFYNLMNNQDLFAELRLRPASRVGLRADVRHLRLASRGDLWYAGGGPFDRRTFGYAGRPSNGHRNLGVLFDVGLDYDPTATTRLTFYFGGVRGGAVPAAIYPAGGRNPIARFLYLELNQRF